MASSEQSTDAASPAAPEDFLISRWLSAPRARVYQAWVDPAQLRQWWAPKGFTCPVCEMDLRPGGRYRWDMLSPDGVVYPFNGEFVEIVPNERLVLKMDRIDPPEEWAEEFYSSLPEEQKDYEQSRQYVDFQDDGGGTRITVRIRFANEELRNAMVGMGMDHGWDGILEKLADALAHTQAERATA